MGLELFFFAPLHCRPYAEGYGLTSVPEAGTGRNAVISRENELNLHAKNKGPVGLSQIVSKFAKKVNKSHINTRSPQTIKVNDGVDIFSI